MLVNSNREDILAVLANSSSIILVESRYVNGMSQYTFPVTIPQISILAIYDNMIVIDNRAKWVRGDDYGDKSYIITNVVYNDGLNIYVSSVCNGGINDFTLADGFQKLSRMNDTELGIYIYPPIQVMRAAKLAIEAASKEIPYSPYKINYMEAPHMTIAGEPQPEPTENPFLPKTIKTNKDKKSDELMPPVDMNPNNGYITFKNLPPIII